MLCCQGSTPGPSPDADLEEENEFESSEESMELHNGPDQSLESARVTEQGPTGSVG